MENFNIVGIIWLKLYRFLVTFFKNNLLKWIGEYF